MIHIVVLDNEVHTQDYQLMERAEVLLVLLIATVAASGGGVTQTDWSGGYGVYGPVDDWVDSFYYCELNYGLYRNGFLSLSRPLTDTSLVWDTEVAGLEQLDMFDIDGDGDEDLFLQTDSLGLLVLENVAGPDSLVEHVLSTEPRFPLCFVDINMDGLIDIIGGAGGICWLENPGDLSGSWVEHPVGSSAGSIDAADIDGDGDIDIVGGGGSNVWWWRNDDGIGSSWSPHCTESWSGPYSVVLSDIDRDGDQDIYYTNNQNYTSLRWLENLDGAGLEWEDWFISTISYNGQALGVADFDRDGDKDPVSSFAGSCCYMAWYHNPGGGSYWSQTGMNEEYFYSTRILIEDLDCDGNFDAIAANELNGNYVHIFENLLSNGSLWSEWKTDIYLQNTYLYTVGDIDIDGLPELIFYYYWADWIMACSLGDEYAPSGYLESSRLYLGCDPHWGYLTWEGETPPGTEIAFQIRASDAYSNPGPWSDTLFAPTSLEGILADSSSYLQYRVILTTTDSEVTPVLQSVEITWDVLGFPSEEAASSGHLSVIIPNPSPLEINLVFNPGPGETVGAFLFDISGRLVDSWKAIGEEGANNLILNARHPGIHFIRLDILEDSYFCKIMVID